MESKTLKQYLLGLVENDDNYDLFYYTQGKIFIDSYIPGNYIFQFTEDFPLGAPPSFKAELIECKFGTTILSCDLQRDEYEMFKRVAIKYQTNRGRQVESRLKDILKRWELNRGFDRDSM